MEKPTFSSIQAAARRLLGVAVRTPLVCAEVSNGASTQQLFIKPEMLQVAGSFKFRGAYNRISQLSEDERQGGVIAWSSGNHAQGVAAAAAKCGVHARIVMPADAPVIKLANTRAMGAEVITYDRYSESREEIARALASRHGGVLVPPFDDPQIIAGQGTAGLELFHDVVAAEVELDALLVCCGGGGLTAGMAIAARELSPHTHVYAVEPEGFDDHARSLRSGRRETVDITQTSICDALLAPAPGELTFSINRELLRGGLVVSEDEVREAMRYAFRALKLVVEPGGAVALAAVLSGKLPASYRRVGVLMSGGNVDPELFAAILKGT